MTRRAFLIRALLATGLLAGAWGGQHLWRDDRRRVSAAKARRLAEVLVPAFAGSAAAAKLGAAYLEQFPDEADLRRLAARLTADWSAQERSAAPAELVARVRRQHRHDFDEGRTVVLKGWIVSITEARVGALAAAS